MRGLYFNDGDLNFKSTVSGIDEFENRLENSLNIFSEETYWDENAGLSFMVIQSREWKYKLDHIKAKILEWFMYEIVSLEYEKIEQIGKTIHATLKYQHSTYGSGEVSVNG